MYKIEYKINGIYGTVEYNQYEENIEVDTLDNRYKYDNADLGYTEVRVFNESMDLVKNFGHRGIPTFITEEIYFRMALLQSKK